MTLILLLLISFQYNRIVKWTEDVWTEDFWSTDSLLATCAYSLYFRYMDMHTNFCVHKKLNFTQMYQFIKTTIADLKGRL